MAQIKNPEVLSSARYAYVTPANSTAFKSGDAVMIDTSNRLALLTATAQGRNGFLGFINEEWSSDIAVLKHGTSSAYSDPATYGIKMRVVCAPSVVSVALTQTSGQAGDQVYLATASTGAYVFTLTKPSTAGTVVEIGKLERDIPSGAAASDPQWVILAPNAKQSYETDIDFYLNNHVIDGLHVQFNTTSKVAYRTGAVIVGGKYFRITSATGLGIVCASHASKARMVLYYIGLGGTARLKDTNGVKFTLASAGTDCAVILKNSFFWPTFTYEGVIFGAGLLRTASSDLSSTDVAGIRRSVQDVKFRRVIKGNPYTSGSPA